MEKITFLLGVIVGAVLGLISALFFRRRTGPSQPQPEIVLAPISEPPAPATTVEAPSPAPVLTRPISLTRPRIKRLGNELQELALLESHTPVFEPQPNRKLVSRPPRDEKSLEVAKTFLAQMPILPQVLVDNAPSTTQRATLAEILNVLEAARCGGKPYSNTQYGEFTPSTTHHAYFYTEILSELSGSDYILTFKYLRVARLAPDEYEYVEGKDRTLIVHPAD